MSIFIKKAIIISFAFISLIFLFSYTNILFFRSEFNFKINDEIVILGHSHPACAFDDRLIDNITNMSQSGEPYFYTYYKIKELISQNKIQTILLEYSNNQIGKGKDAWIWGYNSMNAYLPRHLAFMNINDIQLLYKNNSTGFGPIFSRSIKTIFKKNILGQLSIDNDYGGFEDKSHVLQVDSVCFHKSINNSIKEIKISKTNINYLDKIVSLCKKEKIEILFIRSPQHKNYNRSNELLFMKIKQDRFGDVLFLDFDKFPLKDSEFADYGHVNSTGAKRFSIWFNKLLMDGLLSKENKESVIKHEINKVQMQNKI